MSFQHIKAVSAHDYGVQAKQKIHLNVLAYRGFLGLIGLEGKKLKDAVRSVRNAVYSHAPDPVTEAIHDLAKGADIAQDEILLLNARSEMLSIWANWQSHECTSVAASSDRADDGVARVAQTWDWLTVMRDLPIVLNMPGYVSFLEAGQLAKIAINSHGLAVGLNFLEVPAEEREQAKNGLPIHILIRSILECETVASAIETLRALPRGGAANLMLADRSGVACSAEIRPSKADVLYGYLVTHANMFEHGTDKAVRSFLIRQELDKKELNLPTLLDAFRAHDKLESICSHPGNPLGSSTIATLVAECSDKPRLVIKPGTPCENNSLTMYNA